MEERKIDPFQLIGFALLAGWFLWMMSTQEIPESPSPDTAETTSTAVISEGKNNMQETDEPESIEQEVPVETIVLENKVLKLTISGQGGFIEEAVLKEHTNYLDQPIHIIQDKNNAFDLSYNTGSVGQKHSLDQIFTPTLSQTSDGQELRMRHRITPSQFLDFIYTLPNEGYRFSFDIVAKGLNNRENEATLNWTQQGFRHAKSADYENRYTQLVYEYENDKVGTLSAAGDDDDQDKKVSWISYRQHFFSMILIPENPFKTVDFVSENIMDSESEDSKFLKRFESSTTLPIIGGDIATNFDWFIGPTDYNLLRQYDENLSDSISFGWGIIGWINRFVFFPLFGFLSNMLPYGIAIIVMTIIVRLALSPVTYKSYLSQAKMKVLKPEVAEINEKYKKDAAKRQQETMKLYTKAGASPLAGCVPALLQLPVFLGLFYFFPVAFSLRGQSFLWADDLSSYDVVADLPFSIPFYGDHISLFPILASIAIFIYTRMTAGQQMQTSQPGMPNMKFIMYLMPLMMLFFFNNYASGLSLYYFVSNLITIFIMLVIKNYIIDDAKIHAQIEEKKKKPRKQNRFQRKMQEIMEQAEQQQKANRKK